MGSLLSPELTAKTIPTTAAAAMAATISEFRVFQKLPRGWTLICCVNSVLVPSTFALSEPRHGSGSWKACSGIAGLTPVRKALTRLRTI